jgi:hypothetical protein
MQTSIIYESCDTLRDTVFARMSLFADLYIFPVQERLFQNVIFIGNLDVLPLISPRDIVRINELTLILTSIGHDYVKHIMMLPIKIISSVWKSRYISLLYNSITAILLATILVIMFVSTINTAVTLSLSLSLSLLIDWSRDWRYQRGSQNP